MRKILKYWSNLNTSFLERISKVFMNSDVALEKVDVICTLIFCVIINKFQYLYVLTDMFISFKMRQKLK